MADKVEKFAELIEDRQDDINEAVETFREIGRALESTGRRTGGVVGFRPDGSPYDPRVGVPFRMPSNDPPPAPPAPSESDSDLGMRSLRDEINAAVRGAINRLELEENNPVVPDSAPSAETTPSAEGVTVELEPVEESDEGYPPWMPWAAMVGAGIWGINRKPK